MEAKQKEIFINGKAQVIEMLKLMTQEERKRILKIVKIKNPSLANELSRTCVSFKDIESVDLDYFHHIFKVVRPEIFGLALREASTDFQRKVLSIAPRDYAEKSYEMMTAQLRDSTQKTIPKAQRLVLSKLFERIN